LCESLPTRNGEGVEGGKDKEGPVVRNGMMMLMLKKIEAERNSISSSQERLSV